MKVRLQIHPEYRWKMNSRKHSPFYHCIADKGLKEIGCPRCGEKALDCVNYGDEYSPDWLVACRACDWDCPVASMGSIGGAVSEFFDWMEAWHLLGKPRNRFYDDLTDEFR